MGSSQLGIGIAFLAGLASFLSPCVLPLVPIYLAQLVGPGVYQATGGQKTMTTRLTTFLHALMFVVGFTLSYVAMGATASTLGELLRTHLELLRHAGGIIMVVIGLYLTGILKLPFFYQQKRFSFQPTHPSYPASLLLGIIFAIAWTPCITPILGSILILAANAATLRSGVLLLLIYSLGMALPFLLLGLGVNQLSVLLKRLRPYLGKIEIATGILFILLGVIVYLNWLPYLNTYLSLGSL